MTKDQKYIIKQLHEYMALNYSKAVDALLNGYLTKEDVEMYIINEQSIPQRINAIREDLAGVEIQEKYHSIVSGDKLPTDEFIDRLEDELQILDTEHLRLIKTDAYTASDAKTKQDKIISIEKRIEYYKKQINDLKLSKEEFRPRRKPGRPKKEN